MCFSASVSFAASAVLIPAGIYCIKIALPRTAYLPFACVPFAFGLQQGFEGIVWLGVQANNADTMHFGALAFLFFSHWFWLVWSPFMALRLEPKPTIQHLCRFFIAIGALSGAWLYLPLVINHHWLSVAVIQGSIEYQARFISYPNPIALARLLYALMIVVPLFTSSSPYIKTWGVLIVCFALLSYLIFNYAFVSIWCFFAALLSLYIMRVIVKVNATSAGHAVP